MAITGIAALLETGLKIIDKVIPDPQAKAQAQLELMRLQQQGEFKELDAELQLMLGQVDVNKLEAQAPDLFTRGWRPAAGWVCVAGMAFTFLGFPMVSWISAIRAWPPPPSIPTDDLFLLLLALLGLGTNRMIERIKGKA